MAEGTPLTETGNPGPGYEISAVVAEFSALRDEILQRGERQHHIVALALVAAGTFLTIGVQEKAPATVLLFYPALAFCLAVGWGQHGYRIMQIAVYIRESIESRKIGFGWESHLYEMRARGGGEAVSLLGNLWQFAARGIFLGTELLTVIVALFRLSFSVEEVILLVIDFFAVVGTLVFLRIWRREYFAREKAVR